MRVAVFAFGHVEDDDMGVELRRGIAVNRSGSVMLEGRGHKLAGLLRLTDVAHPRLGVALELGQRDLNTLPVRLPHALVPADQGR